MRPERYGRGSVVDLSSVGGTNRRSRGLPCVLRSGNGYGNSGGERDGTRRRRAGRRGGGGRFVIDEVGEMGGRPGPAVVEREWSAFPGLGGAHGLGGIGERRNGIKYNR